MMSILKLGMFLLLCFSNLEYTFGKPTPGLELENMDIKAKNDLISDFENGLTEDEEKKTIALGIFIVIGTAAAIYIICIAIILLIHKIRKNCCNK